MAARSRLGGSLAQGHTGEAWITRGLRPREGVALQVLIAITLAAIVAASLSTTASLQRLFDNIHWTVSYSTAAWIAWIAANRSNDRDRGPRRFVAMGLTSYAIGQVLWDIQVFVGWNPFPGPSDVFYLLLGPFTVIGLIRFVQRDSNAQQRRLIALDVAGLTIAGLAITLALYLPRRGDLAWLPMAVLVAYPVALGLAACIGIVAALAMHLSPRRGWIMFIGALLLDGGLWLQWNSLTLDNALTDGTLYNAMFSIAALTLGIGALQMRIQVSPSERWARACDAILRLLPLMIVCLAALAAVIAYAAPGVPSLVRWITWISGAAVVLLASVRQSILINDHATLIVTERALREAEAVYRVMFEEAADGILIADPGGALVDVNPRGAELLGMTRDEVLRSHALDIIAPELHERFGRDRDILLRGGIISRDWIFRRKDGRRFPAEVNAKMLPDGRMLGMVRDISERQALEAQLRQAQKMEAIGTLAAGIAHDFNNLITAISGNAELAAIDTGPHHAAAFSLSEIRTASVRAAELVRQIVAFSRPRDMATELVQPARMVEEVARLLRSSLPAGVELRVTFDVDAPAVMADASQLHQVLVNLATNAWQAMEGGSGAILIAVEMNHLPPENPMGLPPGRHACLSVTDTGKGMDASTRERIFEPFFTTKPVGQGTGLGLAIVHRIVTTHRGAIVVDSTPDAGTTFRIYLPAADNNGAVERAKTESTAQRGSGAVRVIYVDDEEALASLMSRQLSRAGYHVQTFVSSEAAMNAITRAPRSFDVLVTDYNMPKLSGLDLIAAVRRLRPDAHYLLTSGLVDDALCARASELGVAQVMAKPYLFDDLQQTLDHLGNTTGRSVVDTNVN